MYHMNLAAISSVNFETFKLKALLVREFQLLNYHTDILELALLTSRLTHSLNDSDGPLITCRCQMACAQGELIKIKITFVCVHTVLTGKCAGNALDVWRPESICVKCCWRRYCFRDMISDVHILEVTPEKEDNGSKNL